MDALKKIFNTFLYFLIGILELSGQLSFEKYTPYYSSITSCEIIQNSQEELRIEDRLLSSTTSSDDIKIFVQTWQKSYDGLDASLMRWNIFYKTMGGLTKVVKDGSIELIGNNPIGKINLAMPFAKALANRLGETIIDYGVDYGISSHREKFEKNLMIRLDDMLLSAKFNNGNLPSDGIQLKAMVELMVNSKIEYDHYPIFNKIMLKKAYEFIGENEEKILKNTNELRILNLKTNKLEKDFEGLSGKVFKNKRDILSNQQAIKALEKQIHEVINVEISELKNSIAKLAINQQKNLNDINKIADNVARNSEKIKKIEIEMSAVNLSLTNIDEKIKEHSALVAENKFYIDVISSYTYRGLSLDDKIHVLEKKIFPWTKEIHADTLKKQINILKDIKERQDFVQVISQTQSIINGGVNTLVENGFLKGKDAKRVGKFMQIFNTGASWGIAYASPNPMTISNAIFSTISLFGKKKKKDPSPEMKFLQAMYKTMNERFNHVNEQLRIIDEKIDTLISLNITLYNELSKSIEINHKITQFRLKNIELELRDIKNSLKEIIERSRSTNRGLKILLRNEVDQCNTLESVLEKENLKLNRYQNLELIYKNTGSCKKCLGGIQNIVNKQIVAPFSLDLSITLNEDRLYQTNYKPIVNIYHNAYLNRAIVDASSSIPVVKIGDQLNVLQTLLVDSIKYTKDNYLSNSLTEKNLINPFEFGKYVEWYLDIYFPFQEFLNPSKLNLYSLDQYFSRSIESKKVRSSEIKVQLEFLLKVLDKGILQQAIFSGQNILYPLYKIIYYGNTPEQLQNGLTVLRHNELVAQNFSKFILYKNFHVGVDSLHKNNDLNNYGIIWDTLNLYGEKMTEDEIAKWTYKVNLLSKYTSITFEYTSQYGLMIKIDKETIRNAKNIEPIYIKAPSKGALILYKMDYSYALFYLMMLRNRVVNVYKDALIMTGGGSDILENDKLQKLYQKLLIESF